MNLVIYCAGSVIIYRPWWKTRLQYEIPINRQETRRWDLTQATKLKDDINKEMHQQWTGHTCHRRPDLHCAQVASPHN
jgi:hypothetical protein